jgi:hypothetical protein
MKSKQNILVFLGVACTVLLLVICGLLWRMQSRPSEVKVDFSSLTAANASDDSVHRAECILNIRNMQQAIRSHANMSGLNPGDASRLSDIVGAGKMVEKMPTCSGGGTYHVIEDRIPRIGELMIRCTEEGHVPSNHSDW